MSRTPSDGRRAPRTAPRRVAAIALAGAAVLALSACGDDPAEPGAAAVVGSDRIAVRDVQTAYTELNEVAQGPSGTPIPQTALLSWLMLAPVVEPEAAKAGVAVSDADAAALLDQLAAQLAAQKAAQASPSPSPSPEPGESPSPTPSPSVAPGDYHPATLAAIRSYLSIENVARTLGGEEQIKQWFSQVLDQLDTRDPQVNPRYGDYARPDVDKAQSFEQLISLIGTPAPNWFADAVTATPQASPPPAEGEAGADPGTAPEELPEENPEPTPTP